jgi:3-hydroxyacyl-[acyl-carrier-protein] dehydratase
MAEAIIDIDRIIKLIPHRYPLLLVDRVLALEPQKSIHALKNVTFNEPHFTGHFPDKPIMPGVLIIEAMAQASALLVASELENPEDKLVYFMSIDETRFRKPVVPGDSLHLHVTALQNRRNVWKFSGEGQVDGQKVAEAVFSAMIVDKPK